MVLKYFSATIDGYKNGSNDFVVLIGYGIGVVHPTSTLAYWLISVTDNSGNVIARVGDNVVDNGLAATYQLVYEGPASSKTLLIPPNCSLATAQSYFSIEPIGQFVSGSLEEVIKWLK